MRNGDYFEKVSSWSPCMDVFFFFNFQLNFDLIFIFVIDPIIIITKISGWNGFNDENELRRGEKNALSVENENKNRSKFHTKCRQEINTHYYKWYIL